LAAALLIWKLEPMVRGGFDHAQWPFGPWTIGLDIVQDRVICRNDQAFGIDVLLIFCERSVRRFVCAENVACSKQDLSLRAPDCSLQTDVVESSEPVV
jgi:hypothetical protein